MKITVDIGHNVPPDGGAVDIGNENVMNLAVGNHLISMLVKAGVQVIPCRPLKASSVNDSLRQRVNTANEANADYFVSIHHNAGGGRGCEVFYVGNFGCTLAVEVCKQLANLGFNNRGAKYKKFFVLNKTKMPAILVETCFVDTQSDMNLWNRVGAEAVAKAIYDGLNTVLKFDKS